VEQTALSERYENAANEFGFSVAEWVHHLPEEVIGTAVPTFMCASDPAGPARGAGGNDRGFQGNYAVCSGGGTPTTPVLADIPAGTVINLTMVRDDAGGMFGQQISRDFRDCVDGTSNTLL